jgi:hypothetical protein
MLLDLPTLRSPKAGPDRTKRDGPNHICPVAAKERRIAPSWTVAVMTMTGDQTCGVFERLNSVGEGDLAAAAR